jgi:hypothetical protein
MALDFVMTLDSDDEAPDLEAEAEVVSAAPLQRDNKKRNGKGKKKQEVETRTSNTRDAGRMKKRKRGDEDDGTEAPDALDKSFTFDGLGGGWSGYSVTDKRDAWVGKIFLSRLGAKNAEAWKQCRTSSTTLRL